MMKIIRKIVEIDEKRCNGCGQCVSACAEGAIQIINGKAKLIADKYCDGLGACLGECPQDALRIIDREACAFDETAVEEHLKSTEHKHAAAHKTQACPPTGCPSAKAQTFAVDKASKGLESSTGSAASSKSYLSHWPVQIRLVPPTAPFLKGADLLVAADCVPVVYPRFHEDFLKDKVVMVGCPKFDHTEQYVQKFTEIFQLAPIRSVTSVVVEVPCCQALPTIIEKAIVAAGKKIPLEKVVISARGQITKREQLT